MAMTTISSLTEAFTSGAAPVDDPTHDLKQAVENMELKKASRIDIDVEAKENVVDTPV